MQLPEVSAYVDWKYWLHAFKEHKLSLNTQKTKCMFFGTSQKLAQARPPLVHLDNTEIESVSSYKYLGLVLDPKLKFDAHVDYLSKKVWPKISTLRRIRQYVTTPTSLYLYQSLIEPCFTFNDYIYDPMSEHDQNRLQVLQNQSLRICLKRGRMSHRADLFRDTGIIPLDVQRKLHSAHFVNRGLNQESTAHVNNMFTRSSDVTERMTRSSLQDKLYIPKCRTQCADGNIRVRGAVVYNQIPLGIRDSPSFNSFKKNLKRNVPFISKFI